ncbi:hypothetical protein AUC43_06275 [Hymenobacter sedentarius]|uniref:Uncharacterized protein n=1 Tax=Hymenobacter sedentarius TaxID=1411621 RepID=A0A0U3SW42_9BACT|nr:hypothetical protein [Hymenobacter sedentarius]ALW84723.1 hypothetical protein AUC43_06275 [Hymenobacter sedentarius]
MRTSLLFALLGLLAGTAHAQDLLTKRTGEAVSVKVVEITPSEVKYRRTDNPDGPLISIWRSDVYTIRYANGTQELLNSNPTPAAAPATTVPVAPASPAPAAQAALPAGVPMVGNQDPNDAVLAEPISLDGPRVGFTILPRGVLDKAHDSGTDLNPFLTQFGWQFEKRLFRLPSGVSGLVEFVPLVGGLEQGQFLPSLSGLVGLRGAKGFEFGVGPNLTPLGSSIVLAMGTSIKSNGINFPINLAMVPGAGGVRVSLLVGFNARHR